MSAVRGWDTTPEMRVRQLVHSMGYRYSLHRRNLPGKPDLVFVSRRKIVFVHGCFWHAHECRRGRRIPASNTNYWDTKRARNKERDKEQQRSLRAGNWEVLVIWECWTRDLKVLRKRLRDFLERETPVEHRRVQTKPSTNPKRTRECEALGGETRRRLAVNQSVERIAV
jgi:DNA mismatch endonuclease (patch repair protein)